MTSWEHVLQAITERLQVRLNHGAVIKLFSMKNGAELTDVKQLEDGMMYVAVDRMPLKMPPFSLMSNGTLRKKTPKKVAVRKLPEIRKKAAPPKEPKSKHHFGFHRGKKEKEAKTTSSSSSPAKRAAITSTADAISALDDLLTRVAKGLDAETADEAFGEMALRLRDRMFQHRQMAPEVTTAFDDSIEEILSYMMQPPESSSQAKSAEDISARFEPMIIAALAGRLGHWESTPTSLVSLVILLDQFPRSVYKNTPDMYSGDSLVQTVVLRAIFHSNLMDEVHPV